MASFIFANHQQFEVACRHLIEKHIQTDGSSEDGRKYSSRVLSGWMWKNHLVHPNQGYMTRKDLKRAIKNDHSSSELDAEEMAEEEDDPASSLPVADSSSSLTTEWMVVYSKTYRIPQLCFNAYKSTGTPLTLSELLLTGVFLQSPKHTSAAHDDHLDLGSGDDPLDTGGQFPLLQRISHPYPHAGSSNFVETVWSIHPCHVQDTVAEVLASTQTDPRTGMSICPSAERREEVHLEQQVAWLECWFMVTSTLMDLRR